jgi:hypothetical protein
MMGFGDMAAVLTEVDGEESRLLVRLVPFSCKASNNNKKTMIALVTLLTT